MALTLKNRQRLVVSTLELGRAPSALTAILARQALAAAESASSSELTTISRDVAQLADDLRAATDPQALQQVLLGPLSQKYEVDRILAQELIGETVVPTVAGFLAQATLPGKASLVQSTTDLLAAAYRDSKASALHAVVGAALRATGVEPTVEELLGGQPEAFVQVFRDIWSGAKPLDATTLIRLGETVAAQARSDVQQGLEQAAATIRDTALERLTPGAEPAEVPWSRELNEMRAATQAVQGLVTVLGGNEDAHRAVAYAQSAVQIGQAVAMLAAASTGWGAVVALSGLASGLGAMGCVGGGAAAADANAPVLAAIENLLQTVKAEFAQVNQKLDDIIDKLEELLQAVADVQVSVDTILMRVAEVDAKVDEALIRMNRYAYQLQNDIRQGRHDDCAGRWLDGGEWNRENTRVCTDLYNAVVTSADDLPAQMPSKDLPEARKNVAKFFGRDFSAEDKWQGLASLARVLREGYGIAAPERVVHGGAVRFAAENFGQVVRAAGSAYREIDAATRERYLFNIRQALNLHEGFQALLRKREDGPLTEVFSHLLESFDAHAGPVVDGLKALYRVAADDFVKELESGQYEELPVERHVFLTNANATDNVVTAPGGAKTSATDPQDLRFEIPLGGVPLPKLYRSISLGSDAKAPEFPLDVRVLSGWTAGQGDDRANFSCNFTFKCYLYGESLGQFATHAMALHFDRLPGRLIAEAEKTNAIRFIRNADGADGADPRTAGYEAIGRLLLEHLSDKTTLAKARDIQASRVMGRVDFLGPRMAQKLAVDENEPVGAVPAWGSAEQGLRTVCDVRQDADTLRAVCRVAYEDAYNAFDSLQALFDGTDEARLLDWTLLYNWARALGAASPDYAQADAALAANQPWPPAPLPARLNALLEAIRERRDRLEQALGCLVDAGERRGKPFPFERAKACFKLVTA